MSPTTLYAITYFAVIAVAALTIVLLHVRTSRRRQTIRCRLCRLDRGVL
jgi:hypothetical protein